MKWLILTVTLVIFHFTEEGFIDNPFKDIPYPESILYRHAGPTYCIESCVGLPDGDYHSCKGCFYFATCSKGMLVDGRKCAAFGAIWWNDYRKRCDFSSPSCHKVQRRPKPPIIQRNCVNNCHGLRNGDYHSCASCSVYMTCSNGYSIDRRPCPWVLEWDDRKKRCEWISSTCTLPRTVPGHVTWP